MSKPYIRFDYQAFTSIYTFVLEIAQNKPITSTINQNFFLQRREGIRHVALQGTKS